MELLEKVADAGGQLLRVEAQREGPAGDEISALRLTFDVGCLWRRPDPLRDRSASRASSRLARRRPTGRTRAKRSRGGV